MRLDRAVALALPLALALALIRTEPRRRTEVRPAGRLSVGFPDEQGFFDHRAR
jgi:hypothetical protein